VTSPAAHHNRPTVRQEGEKHPNFVPFALAQNLHW